MGRITKGEQLHRTIMESILIEVTGDMSWSGIFDRREEAIERMDEMAKILAWHREIGLPYMRSKYKSSFQQFSEAIDNDKI